MLATLSVVAVLICLAFGFCILVDELSWSSRMNEMSREARKERGLDGDCSNSAYAWFRGSILRRGLPTRVALIWCAVYWFAASLISEEAGGIAGASLVLVFLFYCFLNCFFNVDGWLMDMEIDWDFREPSQRHGEGKEQ